jgi:hypothetical protein
MSVVGQGAAGQDDVRGERDQFRSMFYALVGIVLAPASLDPYIPANTPAQFLEALVERRKSVSTFRVVRSAVHEDTNPPQTFRLLRARPERLDDRSAAEQRDEVAPFHRLTPRPTVTDKYSRSGWCIAAKAVHSCPRGLNNVESNRGEPVAYVRIAPKSRRKFELCGACDEVPLVNIVPLIRPNSFWVKSGVADLSCILCFPPRCPSLAWFRCGVHPRGNVFTVFTRHRARSPVGDVHLFSELTGWRPPARLPPRCFFGERRTRRPQSPAASDIDAIRCSQSLSRGIRRAALPCSIA